MPVTTRLASNCNFSIFWNIYWCSGAQSHTISPYSNKGLIKERYKVSSGFLSSFHFKALRISILFAALLIMFERWVFQVASEEWMRPICLWLVTSCIFSVWKYKLDLTIFSSCLRVMNIASVFWGLKFTIHFSAQLFTIFRSFCKII